MSDMKRCLVCGEEFSDNIYSKNDKNPSFAIETDNYVILFSLNGIKAGDRMGMPTLDSKNSICDGCFRIVMDETTDAFREIKKKKIIAKLFVNEK